MQFKNYNGVLESDKDYAHVFFDVDKTLTRSRSLIEPDMREALFRLCSKADVVAVSGALEAQIWKQLGEDFRDMVAVLAQNGNYAVEKSGKSLWTHNLSDSQKREILEHIGNVRKAHPELFTDVDESDLMQDRGCQITFSFVGHNAELLRKERFDPKGERRAGWLKETPFISETVEVKIGGTTSFDYFEKGRHKGANIAEWMKHFGWRPEESLYVGDALFAGGNDDSVFGVCDTLQVSGPAETLFAIRKMLAVL